MDLQQDLPETWFELNQIQQVFLNIIVNAEQAMIDAFGSGRLLITTRDAEGYINISFADNGPGISADNMDREFDPFFTTKEVGRGTGLGLSICYRIVQEHRGRLHVESWEGKGTTFTVEIPIVAEQNQVAPAPGR